eukprot:7848350-Karenia_brevis.AAC.1
MARKHGKSSRVRSSNQSSSASARPSSIDGEHLSSPSGAGAAHSPTRTPSPSDSAAKGDPPRRASPSPLPTFQSDVPAGQIRRCSQPGAISEAGLSDGIVLDK